MDDQLRRPEDRERLSTEFSKDRTHLSFDRTLMSWIRTALSLIGFGIGIFEVVEKTGGEGTFRSSKLVGLLLVGLGVAAVILAIKENKTNHKQLINPDFKYQGESSLARRVAYALMVIGIIAFIHIMLKVTS